MGIQIHQLPEHDDPQSGDLILGRRTSDGRAVKFTISTLGLPTTTVARALANLANPGAVTFLRINADNSVSTLSAADFRTAIGAGTGTGTVTAVTIASANGVSGSSSGGATPALTLTLGAITPTSVNGVTISGSSSPTLAVTGTTTVSGANTGDQTTITGNAGTATTLQTARNINGVSFNGSADITVTAAAGTLTGTTLASGVTGSSLTSVGTLTGGATGAGFTIALSTSTVTGTLNIARIADGSVTLAKLANMATASFLGRNTSGSGVPEVLSVATVQSMLSIPSSEDFVAAEVTGVSVGTITNDGNTIVLEQQHSSTSEKGLLTVSITGINLTALDSEGGTNTDGVAIHGIVVDPTGGSTGHVLTQGADGAYRPEAPTGGGTFSAPISVTIDNAGDAAIANFKNAAEGGGIALNFRDHANTLATNFGYIGSTEAGGYSATPFFWIGGNPGTIPVVLGGGGIMGSAPVLIGSVVDDLSGALLQVNGLIKAGSYEMVDDSSTPATPGSQQGWARIKVGGSDAWVPYYM